MVQYRDDHREDLVLFVFCCRVEPVKEEIETRRESRKASKEEELSAETASSSGSLKWDSTPQNIWLSDSIPETALLKFKTNPKLDAENVLKQSKLHYTGTNFIFANPYDILWAIKGWTTSECIFEND